jgi:hypothetical protein
MTCNCVNQILPGRATTYRIICEHKQPIPEEEFRFVDERTEIKARYDIGGNCSYVSHGSKGTMRL